MRWSLGGLCAVMWLVGLSSSAWAYKSVDEYADEDAVRYEVEVEGHSFDFYVMWGMNPHQNDPSYFAQNSREAQLYEAGLWATRKYMDAAPADWVFCVIDIPPSQCFRLCRAKWVFVMPGASGKREVESVDFIFAEGNQQRIVFKGLPGIVFDSPAQVGRTGKDRIPLWIAFPLNSLSMESVDDHMMKFKPPTEVLLRNQCANGTWFTEERR